MAILTAPQIARFKTPPKPPSPDVRLIDQNTGRPTKVFHDYLTQLYEWQQLVRTLLTE